MRFLTILMLAATLPLMARPHHDRRDEYRSRRPEVRRECGRPLPPRWSHSRFEKHRCDRHHDHARYEYARCYDRYGRWDDQEVVVVHPNPVLLPPPPPLPRVRIRIGF